LSAWVGSLLVILTTASIGVPLGVGAGIYLEEYGRRNWLTNIIEINITNLAGVPSIVFGLLALGLFVYTLGTGRSIFTAGLTLALLILPIIVVATREAIRSVPQALREAAYGIGCTKWQVTRDHIMPAAIPGVLTGVIIGVSRALGETAPLITIGALSFIAFLPGSPVTSEFPFISFQWLFEGFTVLPIQAFNWISRPGHDFHANAAAAGIVLLTITLGLNAIAIYFRYRLRKKLQW
jgi:phosphate transport system permease protein